MSWNLVKYKVILGNIDSMIIIYNINVCTWHVLQSIVNHIMHIHCGPRGKPFAASTMRKGTPWSDLIHGSSAIASAFRTANCTATIVVHIKTTARIRRYKHSENSMIYFEEHHPWRHLKQQLLVQVSRFNPCSLRVTYLTCWTLRFALSLPPSKCSAAKKCWPDLARCLAFGLKDFHPKLL